MAKRKVRNKARDMFTDYYKTNREYSKQNEEAQKEQGKKGWSRSEISMLVVIGICLVGIVIRYVILR